MVSFTGRNVFIAVIKDTRLEISPVSRVPAFVVSITTRAAHDMPVWHTFEWHTKDRTARRKQDVNYADQSFRFAARDAGMVLLTRFDASLISSCIFNRFASSFSCASTPTNADLR